MRKNRFLSKLFKNKHFVITLSLILSVVLWFFVALVVSADYTRTVYNIPVVIGDEKLNMHCFDEYTVDITVTGQRYVVSQLSKDNFKVDVSLSKVTAPGEYELSIAPMYVGSISQSNFIIDNISEDKFKFRFDYFEERSFSIEADITELKFKEDFAAGIPSLSKNSILISGPKSDIDKIGKIVAHVNKINNTPIDKTVTLNADILLYDKRGTELVSHYIHLPFDAADVTVPVTYSLGIPLTVDFLNKPNYFAETPLKFKITPSTVLLTGNSEILNKTTEISVGEIDFNSLTLKNNNYTFDIKLPEGLEAVEELEAAVVEIDLSDYKEITADITEFELNNTVEGSDIAVITTNIPKVKIMIQKDISTPKDLYAKINVDNKKYTAAKYTLNVEIKSKSVNELWAIGEYKAIIQVK